MANFCSHCGTKHASPDSTSHPARKKTKVDRAKKPRKVSAYGKRYGKHFKLLAGNNKKKNGSWKKNGFVRTQKQAHKAAKK